MMHKANDPVSEWQKIEKFMDGVHCDQLQAVFINNNYDGWTFACFYSDINEKYRHLVTNKQIRPASIYKRKISQMSTNGRVKIVK